MNVVMIIPTGIGCEIGGHAGDATPAAKLLAACCDKLILHPNVVNASDINEMPENALYVEGSILDRFLEGEIELKEVNQNRILLVTNSPIHSETINAASAARSTLGVDIKILALTTPLEMKAVISNYRQADGEVKGWKQLVEQVQRYDFDALAIASAIKINKTVENAYWEKGGVNPWGGIEAKASKLIATALNKPVAHAPVCIGNKQDESDFVCDPRMSAEIISWAFLHCVLKGLNRAPRIGKGLSVDEIDCLVSPYNCWGRPHQACKKNKIPIIVCAENQCIWKHNVYAEHNADVLKDAIIAENYLEVAGMLVAMKTGISRESVRRPLYKTEIIEEEKNELRI